MIRHKASLIPAVMAAIGLPLIRHSLRRNHDAERIAAAIAKRERKAVKKAAELNFQALRNASQ